MTNVYPYPQGFPYTVASTSPGINNDSVDTAGIGRIFRIGDIWIRTDNNTSWICIGSTAGAAIWSITTALPLSGIDAARPTAATSLIGSFYYATDTKATYYCVSATTWLVASAWMGPDKASIGGSLANGNGIYCASRVTTNLSGGPDNSSMAVMIYPTGNPTIAENIVASGLVNVSGVLLMAGGAADKGQLQIYPYALADWLDPAGATFTGALNTPHCLAWTFVDGYLRSSWDGAAVQSVAQGAGAYTGPRVGDTCTFLLDGSGNSFCNHIELVAIKGWSTALSDTDLRLVSNSDTLTSYRIPNGTGTVSFDWNAARIPMGVIRHEQGGEEFIHGRTTLSTTIKKNIRS